MLPKLCITRLLDVLLDTLQLFGMSRKLADTLHLYAMDGMGGHIEEFIPTMAKESHLSVVSIPISSFVNDRFLIPTFLGMAQAGAVFFRTSFG